MRWILFIFLVLGSCYDSDGQTWSVLPSATPYGYQDLWFDAQHPDTGVTCGYYIQSFDILPFGKRTVDGGNTMTPLDLFNGGTFLGAFGLAFTDGSTGYMCGGGMLKTTDGGQNWIQQMDVFTVNGTLYDVQFPTANDGYAVGESWSVDGMVMVTHNAGTLWEPYTVSTSANNDNTSLTSVARTTAGQLYAGAAGIVVGSPTLFRSSDDGVTWSPLGFTLWVNDLVATQGDTLFAAADDGVYRFTNAGTTVGMSLLTNSPVNALDIRQGLGFAVCADGSIYRSGDGGDSWTLMTSPVLGTALNSVHIVNNEVAYACGNSGTLLRCDGISTGMGSQPSPKDEVWVFPDPAAEELNVRLPEERSFDRYWITDSEGRMVRSACIDSGSGPLHLDVGALSNGVYILHLFASDHHRQVRFVRSR